VAAEAGVRKWVQPSAPKPVPGRRGRTLGAAVTYARLWTSEAQRADYLGRWLLHDSYQRAHTATGNQPPASPAPTPVTDVMNRVPSPAGA